MKTLPVCIFTKDRTSCARACVEALLKNLACTGYGIRYIVCDDRSVPGHVEAVVDVLSRAGATVSVHRNDSRRWGLGASMNKGLEDAFGDSNLCLRMEDDWLLRRPLDLGKWADCMDRLSIGSIRLGMMFRKPYELRGFDEGLLKVKSDPGRRFTFNNQVALVSDAVYDLCGPYVENRPPNIVEREMADRYNVVTDKCALSPWVCWPQGWATCKYYDETLAFDHVGVSTINHKYMIPPKYNSLNDQEADRRIREKFSVGSLSHYGA